MQPLDPTTVVMVLGFGGLAAGTLGGLLGIGGGILIMPLLRFVMELSPAYAAGTCVVAVFFTTLGGSLKHFKLGHIDIRAILPVMLAGLASSIVFSIIFVYIAGSGRWLDLGAGIVFSLVALRMLWEGAVVFLKKDIMSQPAKQMSGSLAAKVAIGGLAGVLPGLLGIGTGAVLVPAFAFALSAPIKIAIGSSLACFSLNALFSAVCKGFQGYVQFSFLPWLCAGTLIGSRCGAVLNGRFSSPMLKILFGSLFVYVAMKYLFLN
jgi:uncharacterized membrane protein YfcA